MVNRTSGSLSGGYSKYLKELTPLLRSHDAVSELQVFVPEKAAFLVSPRAAPVQTWAGRRELVDALEAFSPDVVFVPTARLSPLPRIPSVCMVRNMEPLTVPFEGNSLQDKARNVGRWIAARQAVRSADRVIAVSDFVREFLVERWRVDQRKVGTVRHGVEAATAVGDDSRPVSLARGVGDFLFTAGSIRPARGLDEAVLALADLRSRGVHQQLVVAGSADAGSRAYHTGLRRLVVEHGLEGAVHWLGNVTGPEMSWCFSHCAVFVSTTRAEACPNTVLEAMSHGCVSISPGTPPMPEFFGETAWYYPKGNLIMLANLMERAIGLSAQVRATMTGAAKARAREFTWSRCADQTVAQLRQAYGDGGSRNG